MSKTIKTEGLLC